MYISRRFIGRDQKPTRTNGPEVTKKRFLGPYCNEKYDICGLMYSTENVAAKKRKYRKLTHTGTARARGVCFCSFDIYLYFYSSSRTARLDTALLQDPPPRIHIYKPHRIPCEHRRFPPRVRAGRRQRNEKKAGGKHVLKRTRYLLKVAIDIHIYRIYVHS